MNQNILDQHQRERYIFNQDPKQLNPDVSSKFPGYPNYKTFAVGLTHDIDLIEFSRSSIFEIYSKLGPKSLLKSPLYLLNQKSNPLWNLNDIIELEKKYNAKSTFFVLATKKDFGRDTNYNIKDIKYELYNILDKDFDIGLHCGYYSYDNIEELKKEKTLLEGVIKQRVIGCRTHYLRFKVPDTWETLSRVGFLYDTSFAYPDFVGFRDGIDHPFVPKNSNILEIPLNIMDCSLFSYMGLDKEYAWKIIEHLINVTERDHGVLTILWHNNYMLGEYKELYEEILRYCYYKNAWLTSTDEIYKWWTE